ncbi:MAG: hypothetical protein L7F78_06615, partial [Syntrophales bacterium LBB04]|nr:hypothetical protein [Syntrophales bacterium LBB04]
EQQRKTKIQADRQELLYYRDKGELIGTHEATQLWSAIVMTFKARLDAVPRKLTPLVLGCDSAPEIQEILQRETDAISNELAEPDLKAIARKVGAALSNRRKRPAAPARKAAANGKPVGRRKPGSKS